jgi:hypothetical protein
MNLYSITRPRSKRPGPPRRGRVRDPKYLACEIWTRICILRPFRFLTFEHSEAAHVGQRGIAQKCSDLETIPLCAEHHTAGKDSHHVLGKRFWAHHGIDRAELLAKLQRMYREVA